jgi:hypothetical protein
MKTRIILFLAISAISTLSFTFISINNKDKKPTEQSNTNAVNAPIGGFMAEDKI